MTAKNSVARFFEVVAELIGEPRFRVALTLFVIGLGALGFAYVYEDPVSRLRVLSFLLSSLGVALLVTAVAEFVLLEHASRAMREQIEKTLDQLRQDFAIVTHSIDNGLVDVLPPRRGDQQPRVIDALSSMIRGARGELRLIGFSLREFLDGGQPLYTIIQDLLRDDQKVRVKAILIDPTTDAARLRTVVEEGPRFEYTKGQLYTDTVASLRSLEHLMARSRSMRQFQIDVRFCNLPPPFYMVASPEALFVEPYHLGRLPGDPPCIGGFVPILRFGAASTMYKRAWAHFEYVWRSRPPAVQTATASASVQGFSLGGSTDSKASSQSSRAEDSVETEKKTETNESEEWADGRYLITRTLEEVAQDIETPKQSQ